MEGKLVRTERRNKDDDDRRLKCKDKLDMRCIMMNRIYKDKGNFPKRRNKELMKRKLN